jgi:hypothetical protein
MNCSKQSGSKKVDFKNLVFLRCLDDLHFKCIFHKQAGSGLESGSEIRVKVGSGSEKKKFNNNNNNFGSTTLVFII